MISKITQTIVNNEIIMNISALVNEIAKLNELFPNRDKYLSLKYNKNKENLSTKQYWVVSDWLGCKLKDSGEVVEEITTFMVWGRTTDIQPIENDKVIQEISKTC